MEAFSTKNVNLEIVTYEKDLYGPQLVPVTIKLLNNEDSVVENLYVYIKSSNDTPKQYVPNVYMEVSMPTEIDPRKSTSIEVYLRNRNPLNMKDLTVSITSELFNKDFRTQLSGLEVKSNQILFVDLDTAQAPATYDVNVKLIYENKTISQVEKQIIIKNYADVTVEQTKTKGLFSTTEKISLYNEGNYQVMKTVNLERNWFQRIFTKASVRPEIIRDQGKFFMSWTIPLTPRLESEIVVKTNYTILALIIAIIIISIILYFLLRSPVILYKKAKIISGSEEGVSDIKIRLHIKNRSGQTIRNIKIIDKYPKIVQLEEESALGSLKPIKMLSADKLNSLLTWTLESLDPYEERLLVYKVKSTLNIVGNITLPLAKVKFHTPAGDRTSYSDKVKLLHKSHHSLKEK